MPDGSIMYSFKLELPNILYGLTTIFSITSSLVFKINYLFNRVLPSSNVMVRERGFSDKSSSP